MEVLEKMSSKSAYCLPACGEEIAFLIPHREPIIMIDELTDQLDNYATSRFTIKHDTLFLDEGELHEGGLIENIAQTAAAGAGWRNLKENTNTPLNFLGSVSNFSVRKYPRVGDTLETRIEIKNSVFNVSQLKGSISLNGEILVECEMKVISDNRKA
jgi:predicted hotdog family 3-hydroxylacyl-ACP dehydratase